MSIRTILTSCLCIIITTTITHAANSVSQQTFQNCKTIILAETLNQLNDIHCLIVKKDDWHSGLTGETAIKINKKVATDFWELQFTNENNVRELYLKAKTQPTVEQIKIAETKDQIYKASTLKKLQSELKKLKLDYNPKLHEIVFFDKGTATLKITESLKGSLNKGDSINVHWNSMRKVSCPTIIPYAGICGWSFKKQVIKNTTVSLGHGFRNFKEAQNLKAEYLKKTKAQ